jgi:transposase
MDGPLISFDVSKKNNHMQGFLGPGKPLRKAAVIRQNDEGFAKVTELYNELKEKTGKEPVAVYEYTGVYAHPLERFLISKGISRIPIAPLESAKFRKSQIRSTKNDRRDCKTIADVAYTRDHPFAKEDFPEMEKLKYLLGEYQHAEKELVRAKNWYVRQLDDVWPEFSVKFKKSGQKGLALVKKFGCPQNIRSRAAIEKALSKVDKRGPVKFDDCVDRFWDYAQDHRSGEIPDYVADRVRHAAEDVEKAQSKEDEIFDMMFPIASGMKETKLLETIPGIGDKLAVRLLAGIGDVRRFPRAKSLVAYAGLDPTVYQSGEQTGNHLSITKKGNAYLRATLRQAVEELMMFDSDGPVAQFVKRKIKDGHPKKAAITAGCSKLLRLVHAMLRDGTCYLPKVER